MDRLITYLELIVIKVAWCYPGDESLERLSILFTANGKWKKVDSCVSQKRENSCISTCLTLLRRYSIYPVNRQEWHLIKSSFSVFWQKGNYIFPFAVNVMLNLSTVYCISNTNWVDKWIVIYPMVCALHPLNYWDWYVCYSGKWFNIVWVVSRWWTHLNSNNFTKT